MAVQVRAYGRDDVPCFEMPERFRHEVTFFASDRGPGGEPLGAGEWWIDRGEAENVLADGIVRVASPLASEGRAEIELSEEQEAWLEWVVKNKVERVVLE